MAWAIVRNKFLAKYLAEVFRKTAALLVMQSFPSNMYRSSAMSFMIYRMVLEGIS